MPTRRIGELLVAEGLISEAAIARALGYQRVSGDRVKLGSILLGWDLLDEDALLTGLGKLHRCPAVPAQTLLGAAIEIVRLIPAAQAIRLGAVAYEAEKGLVRVAFVNPSDLAASDEIAARTGRRVMPAVTSEARLFQAHQKFYGRHIPLEYRPILAKLQRRSTTSALKGLDFREGDLVESERSSTETPLATTARRASVPVEIRPEPEAAPDISTGMPLALPEFPAVAPSAPSAEPPSPASEATPSSERGRTSLRTGDDSLTDWVGRALSSFTGDEAGEPRRSPGGVADPSLFGRHAPSASAAPSAATNSGALDIAAESLPPTNAFRSRATGAAAPPPSAPDPTHSFGIPSTIPPFRRSTDPSFSFAPPVARVDRDDDIVAGMWRPGPDEPAEASPAPAGNRPPADVSTSLSAAARSRDEIADSVLAGALEKLPRVLLLAAGRTGVTGWRGRGPGLTPEAVAAIRIPNSEICVFTSVQESGIPHFGSIDRAEWPRALAALLGPNPPDCAVFPIRLLDGVAAFLYADRLSGPMQYEDFAVIARAAASAAGVLSRFLLHPNSPSSPVRG